MVNCYVILINFYRYHLKDVIVGKIYFLLVRIKIKHMELAIIKRETTGSGKLKIHFIEGQYGQKLTHVMEGQFGQ